MILNIFLILSSVFTGSTIALILSNILVYKASLNFFNSSFTHTIAGVSLTLTQEKTLDILEFATTVIISSIIYLIFYFVYHHRKYNQFNQFVIGLTYLYLSSISLVIVFFVHYSGLQTLLFIFICSLVIYFVSLFLPDNPPKWLDCKKGFLNGIVIGFYLLITINKLTPSPIIPIFLFITIPLFCYTFAKKISLVKNPGFLTLIFALFFPFNIIALVTLLFVTIILVYLLENKFKNNFFLSNDNCYIVAALFAFIYNPLFYFGNFDSVEEGFWAAWIERLNKGLIIYKNFAAYHPPLLLMGLQIFMKLFSPNLLSLRLYFHILQIIGLIIIFYVVKNISKEKWITGMSFIIISAYSMGLVRNNMEIRIASGMFPIFLIFLYKIYKKNYLLYLTGLSLSLAMLISIETGIASLISTVFSITFSSKRKNLLKNIISIFIGSSTIFLIFITDSILKGYLYKFIEYISYYALTFANGYQNIAIERPVQQTILQWYLVSKFNNSSGFIFAMSQLLLLSSLFLIIFKKLKGKFEQTDILAIGLITFGIILTRSALGRSDMEHIAFIFIPSLILLAYLLNYVSSLSKTASIIVGCFFIFYLFSNQIQNFLIQNFLTKLQTFGNLSGSYSEYYSAREKIVPNIDTQPKDMDNLISYIQKYTTSNDSIFVFPQEPEIYFLSDRKNATSFDTPTTFFTDKYQNEMIKELSNNIPKYVIYFGSYNPKNNDGTYLLKVDKYIKENYKIVETFGKNNVLNRK